jgi:2,4-dienoyl-CoA reductase-like NADH-dependent reductase (Old Yellow Enzyme family)/thioredoxin reductase
MNPIKSLMGRRQFLIAAGVTSTSALAYNKLAGVVDPVFQTGNAMAAEKGKAKAAVAQGSNNKYSHLLSPIQIRNIIVKNRMINRAGSPPHNLQGPETYPAEVLREYYATMARGCAIISPRFGGGMFGSSRKTLRGDSAHMAIFDTSDPAVMNYVDQIIESIHSMGSLVMGGGMGGGPGGGGQSSKSMIQQAVDQAKQLEDQGYDVMGSMGIRNISDKSSLDQALAQNQAIMSATNLLISMSMMVKHPDLPPETNDGQSQNLTSLESAIETAKAFDGYVDILQVTIGAGMASHPTNWNMEKDKPMTLSICKALRDAGVKKTLIAPNGGYHDPSLNDKWIASGLLDMVVMSRAWNADDEYGKKLYDGRGEDIYPCIMCNKCHGLSMNGPWITVCSVNPRLGLESAVKTLDKPATFSKKVAVIGGGPAGMKAAITAAERGHKVTLYEKTDSLGGLLKHAKYSKYKWTLNDYSEYLIRQVKKLGVEVQLNRTATPEMIKAKGYDAVIAALGAEPVISKMSGSDAKNVFKGLEVYGDKEKELGKNVVFIGGGEWGVETAIYIAEKGHNVMVLSPEKELLRLERVHYPEYVIHTYDHMKNFDYVTEAIATRIADGKVYYRDASGAEKSVAADSVVIWGGLKAKTGEAVKFSSAAGKAFYAVGDCTTKGGNVQKSVRTAYFAAVQI